MTRTRVFALWIVAAVAGCAGPGEPVDPAGPAEAEDVDEAFFDREYVVPKDGDIRTVDDLARSWTCSTGPTRALDRQIARELACLAPGRFLPIDDIANLHLGPGARPFLQADAARALRAAVAAVGRPLVINSGWRSLAQQYLMKRWEGGCGIRVAATPGRSAHQSGLAVDLSDYGDRSVRRALEQAGFVWYCSRQNGGYLNGCRDPVHFDMRAGEDLRALSVLAFQKLWNRNHPEDPIAEDGLWGWETRRRLDRAPLAGFPREASCGVIGDEPAEPPPSAAACGFFADVPGDHPAYPEIEATREAGFFGGCATQPPRFCPADPISRGMLATVLADALRLPYRPVRGVFDDLPRGHWAAEAAEALYDAGLVGGCDEGRFCPERSVSRAELAVLVAGVMSLPPVTPEGVFADVPPDHWAAGTIEALHRAGVVAGCEPDRFCPDRFATRAQVAVLLARAFDLHLPARCE